jgi:hypothetical protein
MVSWCISFVVTSFSRARATAFLVTLVSLALSCTETGKAPEPAPAGGIDSLRSEALSRTESSTATATWPQLPRRRLETIDSAGAIPGRPFSVRLFHYAARQDKWPYGTGISLWREAAATPAWVYFLDGDFPPHSITWRDLSGDGISDLFFLTGEEDVFGTVALVSRDGPGVPDDSLLVPIYSDSNSYALLADLDGDGLPELIASGEPGDRDAEAIGCDDVVLPPALAKSVEQEYTRLATPYREANFSLNGSGNERFMLHLLHPIRIFSLRGGVRTDVTRRFGTHLRWRIEILEQLRPNVSPECKPTLEALLVYLRSQTVSVR